MASKSIIVENESFSVISGEETQCRHHLIFGNGRRELSEEDGLWIPLTNAEHNLASLQDVEPDMFALLSQIHENPMAEHLSKIAGQLAWEGDYYRRATTMGLFSARRAFRQRYGKSYL